MSGTDPRCGGDGCARPFGWIHDGEFHGLTAAEIAVVVTLRSFGGEVGPSLGTIADRVGMPVAGVRRTLESLGAKGWIIRSREDDE